MDWVSTVVGPYVVIILVHLCWMWNDKKVNDRIHLLETMVEASVVLLKATREEMKNGSKH